MSHAASPATLADIASLLDNLPLPDQAAIDAARARDAQLTKPPGALGRLETLATWIAGWQGRHPPRLDRVMVAVFAGWHGVTARGISAFPAEVTGQMVLNFRAGGAAINQLARVAGARLEVVELSPGEPTQDFTRAAAMSDAECAAAFAKGFTTVDAEDDLLVVGEMGIGNTTAAAAVLALLYGEPGAAWAGPGTGLDAEGVARKAAVIEEAQALHGAEAAGRPLEVLRRVGGREIAAMAGAILAARRARMPVLLDGFVAGAAAAVLEAAAPGAIAHCLAGHRSAEPGHRKLLHRLELEPLLDLGMRLGEASGAATAVPILRAAVECHTGMATFAEAGVSGKDG